MGLAIRATDALRLVVFVAVIHDLDSMTIPMKMLSVTVTYLRGAILAPSTFILTSVVIVIDLELAGCCVCS
jgi:hypothetical protein